MGRRNKGNKEAQEALRETLLGAVGAAFYALAPIPPSIHMSATHRIEDPLEGQIGTVVTQCAESMRSRRGHTRTGPAGRADTGDAYEILDYGMPVEPVPAEVMAVLKRSAGVCPMSKVASRVQVPVEAWISDQVSMHVLDGLLKYGAKYWTR